MTIYQEKIRELQKEQKVLSDLKSELKREKINVTNAQELIGNLKKELSNAILEL